MSYLFQFNLSQDGTLRNRITACAALEGVPDPSFWVNSKMWEFSAQPDWVKAYRLAAKPAGSDENAITDDMILAAVQKLRPSPEEEVDNAN